MNRDCLTCKSFESFRDNYNDDEEPDDRGFCHNMESPYYFNEGDAGSGVVCDFYEMWIIQKAKVVLRRE